MQSSRNSLKSNGQNDFLYLPYLTMSVPSMLKPISEISNNFDLLIPDKLQGGLLIILLRRRIEEKEIDDEFTRHDIQGILEEIARQENVAEPQIERILKKLLHFFLLRPPDRPDRYYLSEHAINYALLIEHALESPYRDFPLKKNFEKYFKLDAEDIQSITDFEEWYQQNFVAASRKVISEHLGSLQDELDKSIHRLNIILYSDKLTALEMAQEFAAVFQQLDLKRKQISDALFFKEGVVLQIKTVVSSFYQRIESAKHHQTEEETKTFQQLHTDWTQAQSIQREVNSFFKTVDKRLERIGEQITFSSTKLSELQENFKAQSRFKMNLRRMLELILKESRYGRESLTLPDWLPKKELPYEEARFFAVPYYDFALPHQNESLTALVDETYEAEQRSGIERVLERQEKVKHWVGTLEEELERTGELYWSDRFFEILEVEQDADVSVQVGFELVQRIQARPTGNIEFSDAFTEQDKNEFSLWKMTIRKS